MNKIEILSVTQEMLFTHEIEENNISKTVQEAIKRQVNLSRANLEDANLRSANLEDANLYGANLYGANLENLPISYINQCSREMLFIFQDLRSELPFLKDKLIKGQIDGSQYQGEYACLIGTLANADGGIDKVCGTIPFYDKGLHNYSEQWFFQIRKNDTPETNAFAAHALKLIDLVLET